MKSTKDFAIEMGGWILKGIGLREVLLVLPTVRLDFLLSVLIGICMMIYVAWCYKYLMKHHGQYLQPKKRGTT